MNPFAFIAATAKGARTFLSATRKPAGRDARAPFFLALAALLLSLATPGPAFSQSIAAGGTLSATPLLPGTDGTYYYEGFDSANSRYVFISTTGTYFYVDSGGNTTVGGTIGTVATASPYRAVVQSGTTTFQFYNRNAGLYTPVEITTPGGVISGTSFAPRGGFWSASDVTFTLDGSADASGLWIEGYSNLTSATGAPADVADPVASVVSGSTYYYRHNGADTTVVTPAIVVAGVTVRTSSTYSLASVFSGTNVNILSPVVNNSSRQALSIRNDAAVFLYGGTISKIATATGEASETFYLVGNQEGLGSSAHFHGEDLAIITSGTALEAFNLGGGHTTADLYRSTITSTIYAVNATTNHTQVFNLNDQSGLGGAHFYGEDLAISIDNSNNGAVVPIRVFAFGYGANTIALKNSTLTSNGKGAVFRWKTSEGTGGYAGGNEAMHDGNTSSVTLENTSIFTTGNYAPIFQQTGRFGSATVVGGTLSTTGANSPIIRLAGANDAQDEARFTGLFTNVLLEAPNSSAIDLDINVRDSTNYGEDGGGVGKEVTTLISTAWDLVFQSSTLNAAKAMRIATAGADNSPFANETKLTVRDSVFNGRIEMLVSGVGTGVYETTGANLRLKGERSTFTGGFYLTGTEVARKYHEAELYLIDSFFGTEGAPAPVTMENRGGLVIKFDHTPMVGDITLSGSTRTYLDLTSSPVTGSISLAGTALLQNSPGLDLNNRAATVRDSSISGGFNLAGASSVDLTLTGNTTVSGGITATDAATATLRFKDSSSINGGVTLSGSSSVTLVLSSVDQLTGDLVVNDRARLALATFAGTPISLDRNFDLGGIWSIPGKTTLVGTLDLTSPLATLSIVSAAKDSLILKSGLTGNGRLDIESIDGALVGAAEIHVIRDETNTFVSGTDRPLILSHPVDYGLAAYTLENRADGAYLVGGLDRGSYGTAGAAVLNTTALSAQDYFSALEPLQRHASDLRDRAAAGAFRRANFDTGDLWVQGRAVDTEVDRSNPSLDFTQRTLGITAGADAHYDLGTATLATGVFADTATTLRDFISTADGRTVTIGAGFTALWAHRNGLYASGLARFDTSNHTLDTHSPNNALSADYHTQSGGIALEAGWRLGHDLLSFIPEGWWFEPSLGFGYAKLAGATYTTESNRENNIIDITLAGAKALQYRAALAVGYKLDENWNLLARLAYANVDASGGTISGGGVSNVATLLDGARYEAAVGVTRRVGANGRIHLDYAYTSGDDYTRPYTLTLGYSHLW
ncbi:autotransporter outer membrane beta-barrel domain-containing protein [Termitidicoccus mucosus]|uniref:Autotransporter domain-containing protein n=1 Tax=Termitidicoccus mucosus TaxID=1184151 RepID=A0A178IGX9_9BACT|nr:hypothetical protein AW736_19015 [Opitutaceae bacterium TSB47]